MKKSLVICLVAMCIATTSFAQEKPFRIGLKFGVPNVAGLNVEYATPVHFAPTVDFSIIPINTTEFEVNYTYFELGTNYYFNEDAKGFYGHLSYGRIGFNSTYTDENKGVGEANVGLNLANLKLGAKFGNGFYFRPEIGYGLLLGDAKFRIEYIDPETGAREVDEEQVPGPLAGGFLFNIGFGVAF